MNHIGHQQPGSHTAGNRSVDQRPTAYTVQLLGFNERERTLFGSIFSLSKHRPVRYVEFNPDIHPHADYFIVDSDDAGAVESFFMIDPASCGGGIFVGQPNMEALRSYPVIQRPIRWAEVMLRIDALPRPSVPSEAVSLIAAGMTVAREPVDDGQERGEANHQMIRAGFAPQTRTADGFSATLARAEDDLELSQVTGWYDRSTVTDFRTEPSVLVVDGDIASRRYMAAKLMDLKYRVDYAQSSEQALLLLSSHRYNAVFIDPKMPDVDGYDLARSIKSRNDRRRIAVIFSTDKPTALERVRASMAGADVFLAKPFDQGKLISALDKFLPNWRISI